MFCREGGGGLQMKSLLPPKKIYEQSILKKVNFI